MKVIISFFLAWLVWSSLPVCAQQKGWQHGVEGHLLFSFKPSESNVTQNSPNNTLLTYVYHRFKGYKYPGLYLGYNIRKEWTKKWCVGFSAGCQIRYLEPVGNSEYITYYSFPLTIRPEWHCFHYRKHDYDVQWSFGYNFKHPKHKTEDGTGGGTWGMHFLRYSKENKFYLRFGYDFFQENSFLEYKADPKIAGSVDETFHYTRYLNQFVFGMGKRLN